MKENLDLILNHITANENKYVDVLREAVAIPSVSNEPSLRPQVTKMAEWIQRYIETHIPGSSVALYENKGKSSPQLPPLVIARIGKECPEKKTLLVYAHYDVQPAHITDGWDQEPFELTRKGDVLYGRGSTDDKGPLIGWLNVFKAFVDCKQEMPVNVRLISEGMEEAGSEGFEETVTDSALSDFFKGVNFCCISDNYWLGTQKPCLTYGLRGVSCISMTITGPKMDLHSGMFGGQVYQPMDDLVYLFNSLKDRETEEILIPGIKEMVAPVTPEELEMYKSIDFSISHKKMEIDVTRIRYEDDKTKCLMSVWRQPSLTIHGIEGAVSDPGFKTCIPRRIIGKFSIRIVPNIEPKALEEHVRKHIQKHFDQLKSPNKLEIDIHTGMWWYVDPSTSTVFKAARSATRKVHNVDPDLTREGGSIPITGLLGKLTNSDVCLIPMGRSDDGAHAQNEKLDVSNYIQGMKVFASFLQELSVVS